MTNNAVCHSLLSVSPITLVKFRLHLNLSNQSRIKTEAMENVKITDDNIDEQLA